MLATKVPKQMRNGKWQLDVNASGKILTLTIWEISIYARIKIFINI